MAEQRITIGKILAPHGVKGEVRVLPLTDFPERFATMRRAFLETGQAVEVEAARFHKRWVLLKLRGFDTMTAVEPLRGLYLQVDRADAAPLPPGHYYIFDIIGMTVYTDTGERLGVVTDILATGSNDVYVVEKAPGAKPLLIPAIKDVVRRIDTAGKTMTVTLLADFDEG